MIKITFILIITLCNCVNIFSQENKIDNKSSPNSVNIQGSNNKVNYSNANIQNELIERYIRYGLSKNQVIKIFSDISKESQIIIPDSLINEYSKSILSIYDSLSPNSIIKLNDIITSLSGNIHSFDITIKTKSCGHSTKDIKNIKPFGAYEEYRPWHKPEL